jgi:hypothetical protein
MTFLTSKWHAQSLSEAQAFFAERRPLFPFGRASITFVAVANLAATVATLLGQG